MKFFDHYRIAVQKAYPANEINIYDHNEALKELGVILDNNVPAMIHEQELALTNIAKLITDLNSTIYMRAGSITVRFMNDIVTALTIELTAVWTVPWLTTKTAAALISPTPPASLFYTASSPVGTNLPFSDGEKIVQYFEALPYVYTYVKTFSKALASLVSEQYPLNAQTGPLPYLPL